MPYHLKIRSHLAVTVVSVLLAIVMLASCGSSADSEATTSVGAAEAVVSAETQSTAEASSNTDNTAATTNDADHNDADHDDADHNDADHDDADHDDADHDDADHDDADHDDADHDDADHDDADHDDADHEEGNSGAATPSDSTTAIANASYLGSYTLVDESFGTVVEVTVDGATRTVVSNAIPNHETGEFPTSGNPNVISEQDRTWTLTTDPTYVGQPQTVRESGVALNGVKFEPGTAEVVDCSSGESYRVEGLQEAFDLGMDFNNAHVQPTGEYHYHGVSDMLVDAFADDADLVLVGFASDGHLMYYSKSNAYQSSYSLTTEVRTGTDCAYRTGAVDIDGSSPDGTYVSDWAYTDGLGDLDQCNGTIVGDEYAYIITEQYPYISRCLMGEVTEAGPGAGGGAPADGAGQDGGGQGGGAPADGGGQGGGAPDLTEAAAALGLTEVELQTALGGPPPDISAAAATLGISEDELIAVLTEFGVAPPNS